ncbi:hypothetical protein ACQY1M_03160 [Neorhizobium sp. DAR64861/K0K2]|nr:hypothetical protein [uncultured Rhizobium sp.]
MAKRKVLKKRSSRRRAPPLDAVRITEILSIMTAWKGRLTWNGLCNSIAVQTGNLYTRQALNNYIEIKAAYAAYQKKPRRSAASKPLSGAQQRIVELERKVLELEAVRDALLEKFARWAVNAATRNLDEDFLNQPLRQINRADNH